MLRRILPLIIKEFLAIWQDKKSRCVLIIPPLLQLFIFSFAATLDVKNVSVAILNHDTGKLSWELVERFEGSPFFTKIIKIQNNHELKEVIDTQKAVIAIHIDEQFSRNILSGKTANVQVVLDGRKSNTAQIVFGYASKIVDQYIKDLSKQIQVPTPTTYLITRNWFNPNLLYMWFTVPGLVAILTMFTSLLVTALSIAREREMGTFEQLLVSPLTSMDILIGKSVPGIVIGMGVGTIIFVAAITIFQIPFTGSIFSLYLSMLFFVASTVGVGLFLSSLCKTQQQALLAVFFFMSNSVILSGFATPIENMPLWLQHLTLINPLRHFITIVRGIFLKDLPFNMVFLSLYPIVLISITTLSTAAWFFRKRLE